MMAASPSAAGGFNASGSSVRKSEEIADLIDLFSKMQYRAKEVSPRVRSSVFTSVTQLHQTESIEPQPNQVYY